MKIRKIKIKNFRNLRDIELCPAHTTIFVGENNTGKSNFLHALRLLLDPDARKLGDEISNDDINDMAHAEGENYFSIVIEIGDLQKHQELEAIFMDRIARDGSETYVTIEGRYEPDENGTHTWKCQVLPPKERRNDPIQFSVRMAHSIPLYFLEAVRNAERETKATGRGVLSQLLSDISLEDVEKEVIENIQKANKALGQNKDITDLAKDITSLLSPHIPSGKGEVSIAVATEDPTQIIKGLRLNVKLQSDYKAYEVSRHGTGLQNLLLIAMFRHKIFKERVAHPILAIEEPEAHLHPQALRCLFKDLEKIDNPILLTTHSPAIVECSDPLGIVRMASKSPGQVTAHQLNSSKIDNNDLKLLARMMRAGRADAFFARSIIVVDGQSELITLPAFAEQIGHNLHRDGVSVVSADGHSFAFILRACNKDHFSIPTVVAFDTDVLDSSNDLLSEAFKAGLIDENIRKVGKDGTPDVRREILKKIGWIPVVPNFEEEVARIGYLPLILRAIDDAGATESLNNYLGRNSFTNDAHGVAQFLNDTGPGRGFKVTIARAVANEVRTMDSVPDCFDKAIKQAAALATGG
jgi:putative ATP-dependent endonuclease of OLD family